MSNRYEKGDIVRVSEFVYPNGKKGDEHYFVIIDDDQFVTADYFAFLTSSHTEKSKENSPFKYNEPLNKDNNNNLALDSIVKCDEMYRIPPENILYKLGSVDVDDYIRFVDAYNNWLKGIDGEFETFEEIEEVEEETAR